jgi:chromosome segregation ATPase
METSTGPGMADAQSGDLAELRRQFAEFGEVQANQSRTLDIHTGKLNALERGANTSKLEMHLVKSTITAVREEFSGRFERLDNDVAGLRREIIGDGGLLVSLNKDIIKLRDDVTTIEVKVDNLQTDVSRLKADVSELKADVSELKTDVSELKTDMADVKGSLKEILNRLPAKAA